MATSPIYSWPEPDNTDLVKNGALAIRTLGNAIDTTMGTMVAKTIIDAKGDLIAGTAADTAARLAVGNNGETLVADSAATTGLRYQSNFAAGKNAIINGAFNVWQRGTSISLTNNTYAYGADRFIAYLSFSAGTASFSQQTFTPGTAPVAGYEGQYFGRITCGSTSSYLELNQRIEDVRTFAGQTVTFSFWAKSSAAIVITPLFNQNFGSGGSSTVSTAASNITLTTSWVRYTSTIALPSISGKTIGTNSYLNASMTYASGTLNSATIDTWGWQVEASNTATAFQTATGTIQGELAACQRYYQIVHSFTGNASTTTQIHAPLNFVMPMRTSPSVAGSAALYVSDGTNDFQQSSTNVAFVNGNRVTSQNCQLVMTNFTGMTQWRSYMQVSTAGGDIQLSAEL